MEKSGEHILLKGSCVGFYSAITHPRVTYLLLLISHVDGHSRASFGGILTLSMALSLPRKQHDHIERIIVAYPTNLM